MYFHEEEHVFDVLEDDSGNRIGPVIMSFPEGDSYLCEFNTAWESENDYDDDDPDYDEYWEEWYDVIEVLTAGPNLECAVSPDGEKSPILLITYKHFPSKITFEGNVIYESAGFKV